MLILRTGNLWVDNAGPCSSNGKPPVRNGSLYGGD